MQNFNFQNDNNLFFDLNDEDDVLQMDLLESNSKGETKEEVINSQGINKKKKQQ